MDNAVNSSSEWLLIRDVFQVGSRTVGMEVFDSLSKLVEIHERSPSVTTHILKSWDLLTAHSSWQPARRLGGPCELAFGKFDIVRLTGPPLQQFYTYSLQEHGSLCEHRFGHNFCLPQWLDMYGLQLGDLRECALASFQVHEDGIGWVYRGLCNTQ